MTRRNYPNTPASMGNGYFVTLVETVLVVRNEKSKVRQNVSKEKPI